MKMSVILSLIGLLLGMIGSIILLLAVSYNEIQNVSFNRIEVNGQLVNEDRAVSVMINKFYYFGGISLLIVSFLLQSIGLLINN